MDPSPCHIRTLSRTQLKYTALVPMVLNHAAAVFLPEGTLPHDLLMGIGYFTAPVLCFLLAEGFRLTHSLRGYLTRLLVFALLSQFPYDLAFTKGAVLTFVRPNVLFSLLSSLLVLTVQVHPMAEPLRWLLSVGLICASMPADWGVLAPVFTLLFFYCGPSAGSRKEIWALVVLICAFMEKNIFSVTGPLLAAFVVLTFYRGTEPISADVPGDPSIKKERPSALFDKWFFYFFYPAHLLLLGCLRLMICG